MEKIKKLVTHDGTFHADDVFATATLMLFLEKKGESCEIKRSRILEIIKEADYVYDVGDIYDETKNRFDHHQKGGAGRRADDPNIEYASFGLIWKKFGVELCGNQKVVDIVDKKLVAPIDAGDNGFDLSTNTYDVSPYLLQYMFSSFQPTWREDSLNIDEIFLKSVEIAKNILSREIIQTQDALFAEEKVITIYKNSPDKRIIILDENYPYQYILNNFSEPLFVVYPRKNDGKNDWGVKAVRVNPKGFNNRKDFPASWGGLRVEDLVKITGVEDAVFCHRGLFMVVARSKEGAIKLAQIAVES